MRIGIFGGTFDPPHLGHLILACEAHYQLELDRLLWVLTPSPPHKPGQPISDTEVRLELVAAAIADSPAFSLSRVEIDRPGPHYALETVALLREAHPGDDLIYLIGGDSLHDLPDWHRPQEFVLACDALGVMRRPGDHVDLTGLEGRLPGLTERVRFIDAPLLEISSTQIRRRIARGQPCRYYLPPAVHRIIQQRGLYRSAGTP
jgi:nicotinate-nucleotide adenylyltransferase